MTHSPTTATPTDAALKREAAPASSKRRPLALALAALAVAALLILSLSTGEYSILSQDDGWQIFLAVRVPRTIALVLSGACDVDERPRHAAGHPEPIRRALHDGHDRVGGSGSGSSS